MSDFDDLDGLFGPLRSDATPAELACERDTVALMAANHASSKGTTMFTSRRSRVATLIAAGIIGFGGVAAAGSGVSVLLEDEPVEEEPVVDDGVEVEEVDEGIELDEKIDEQKAEADEEIDEEKAEAEEVIEDLAAVVGESTGVDDLGTDFNEANDCLPGNHGATVSAAARGDDDAPQLDKYEQSVVAQSSCGKTDDVDATEDEDEDEDEVEEKVEVEEEVEEEEPEEEVEQPAAPTRGKSDQAPGRSNGNGKKGD